MTIRVPSYNMEQVNDMLVINFQCIESGELIAAIINDAKIYPKDGKADVDISFSENTISKYNDNMIKSFQEQIAICVFHTFEEQSRKINAVLSQDPVIGHC